MARNCCSPDKQELICNEMHTLDVSARREEFVESINVCWFSLDLLFKFLSSSYPQIINLSLLRNNIYVSIFLRTIYFYRDELSPLVVAFIIRFVFKKIKIFFSIRYTSS